MCLHIDRKDHLECHVTLTYKVTRECHSYVGYTIDFPDPRNIRKKNRLSSIPAARDKKGNVMTCNGYYLPAGPSI